MKAIAVLKVVAVAVTLLLSVNTNATIVKEKKYFTNEVVEQELVVSKIVYEMNGTLIPYMRYDYTYDEKERITHIEVFKWDNISDEWNPNYKTSYVYNPDTIDVELGYWNEKEKKFNANVTNYECELSLENIPVASNIR